MTPERMAELRRITASPIGSLLTEALDEIERLDVIVGRWEGLADTYLARVAELEIELADLRRGQ